MKNIIAKLSAKTIKQKLSPLEFYQSEINLKSNREHGWVDGGLCQFHDDTRAGNFRVNLDFGGFTCFACGAKGSDVIAFIQERDGLTFPETLRYLNEKHGVG
jgi:DNA primase